MNGHRISFPGATACDEPQDGSLLAGKVVGKEETEVYADQEDGQNEKLQNEEMSREIKEKRHQPYRGRFLQAGEFRYIQLGEPCLHLVSGPQSDIVK